MENVSHGKLLKVLLLIHACLGRYVSPRRDVGHGVTVRIVYVLL